jgi:hypothetical protein
MAAEGSPLKRLLHKLLLLKVFHRVVRVGAGLGRFALTI